MPKVLIVIPGFVQKDQRPITLLKESGFEVEMKDYGLAGLNKNEEEFCKIIKGVDAVIVTAMDKVTRRIMESADRLKMVAIRSAGFEGTDMAAASDHNILVTHNPGANRHAVADMTVGLMLSVSRKIGWMDRGMREGKFQELRQRASDIYKKRLGIIGLGKIGKTVALRVQGFEMKIMYHDIVEYPEFARELDIEKVPLDRLLEESDIVSLHVPVDAGTRHMIDESRLRKMKPDAILINTCRGGVVVEDAVYEALTQGRLRGYGTDVHEEEPPVFLDMLRLDNVVSTPHVAGVSEEGLMNMAAMTVNKVIRFIKEKEIPENVLNPAVIQNWTDKGWKKISR